MDRFKFRLWTQYPGEDPCYASDYEMDRCMLEKSYTIVNGIYSVEPEEKYQILEQCTGLKDKNGKLIFEGDIVRLSSDEHSDVDGTVVFEDMSWFMHIVERSGPPFMGTPRLFLDVRGSLEVIGNIHENGDLLI